MRTRRWVTWLVFTICAVAVVEGLGWVTWKALRLERAESEARAQASFQELIRLALWRMESEITPIVATEAARPYFHYQAFYPAERAYTAMLQEVRPGEVQVPSPLLDSCGQFIRLHYQIGPDGAVTSPQAPTGNQRDIAESRYVNSAFIVLACDRLSQVTDLVRPPKTEGKTEAAKQSLDELAMMLDKSVQSAPPPTTLHIQPPPPPMPQPQAGQIGQVQSLSDSQSQIFSQNEYAARQQVAQSVNSATEQRRGKGGPEYARDVSRKDDTPVTRAATGAPAAPGAGGAPTEPANEKSLPAEEFKVPPAAPAASPAEQSVSDQRKVAVVNEPLKKEALNFTADDVKYREGVLQLQSAAAPEVPTVTLGAFEPLWATSQRTGTPQLILRRQVTVGSTHLEQGFWMDWPSLRERLLTISKDLVPAADLVPVTTPRAGAPVGQMLASIPVLLVPGDHPVPAPEPLLSTAHITLGVTWLAVLGGIVAIAVVLQLSMDLGDRRGRFVSAVTHELRTPLTTFRLYTGMLAGGMVRDDAARREYLATLESESGRLAGIVENVLDYARLGGRPARANGTIDAAELLAQVVPSLDRAATRCGMSLVTEGEAPSGVRVHADAQTVERILLNLVDNACKYARESSDQRIHLAVGIAGRPGRRQLEIRVRDHGPGVPRRERKRVFRAFHRSKRDAQGPQSGLGLGLALARGLARELGGDLDLLRPTGGGAELRLLLQIT